MNILEKVIKDARPWKKKVALVVDDRPTFFEGVKMLQSAGVGQLQLIGHKPTILERLESHGISVGCMDILDIRDDYRTRTVVGALRRYMADAVAGSPEAFLCAHPNVYGLLCVQLGLTDVLIGDRSCSYEELALLGKSIVGCKEGVYTVTSTNILLTKAKQYGAEGALFFSDCAVVKNPTAEELADIAISTAALSEKVFGHLKSRVSLLSFSTKGSAKDPLVDKVIAAGAVLEKKKVQFHVDCELQLDASIDMTVGARKAPNSTVAGHANVLIFPDLHAANIGYNLVNVFGDAPVIGPILLGLKRPVYRLPENYSGADMVLLSAVGIISST